MIGGATDKTSKCDSMIGDSWIGICFSSSGTIGCSEAIIYNTGESSTCCPGESSTCEARCSSRNNSCIGGSSKSTSI